MEPSETDSSDQESGTTGAQKRSSIDEINRRFRFALENSPITLFEQDLNLRYTWLSNPGVAERVIGKTDGEIVHATTAATVTLLKRRVLETGKPLREEVSVTLGERELYVDLFIAPLLTDSGDIIGVIGASTDITERKNFERALQEGEERYRTLFDQSIDGIFLCKADGRFQAANGAGYELLGYSPEELTSARFSDIVLAEDMHSIAEILSELAAGKAVRREANLRRKDGVIINAEITAQQLADGLIQAVVRDITERKQREDQINLLMREVNHRSKNLLAVVQALARQTADTNLSAFRVQFEERLASLSASQNLLVEREWMGVTVGELVRAQLAHYEALMQKRILMSGPPVTLPASVAQQLGLIIHELGTNAGKYGALSNSLGVVEMKWWLEPQEGVRLFCFKWTETGGPEVAVPTKRGFGSRLIERALGSQQSGTAQLEFSPTGVICSLRIDLSP